MLSRTADSLFWLARYVERADNTARIIDAASRLTAMPVSYAGSSNEWQSALAAAGWLSFVAAPTFAPDGLYFAGPYYDRAYALPDAPVELDWLP